MEAVAVSVACVGFFIAFVIALLKALNSLWLRPKRVERCFREQGLKGNSYKFLFGDLKEMSMLIKKATSKPININDDIVPRVIPFHYQLAKNYGKNCFFWVGTKATVMIRNPETIKDVFNNIYDFSRPPLNPLLRLLVAGLFVREDENWTKHRKIMNPAFNLEKLKCLVPAIHQCGERLINEWITSTSEKGWCELDIWPFVNGLTADVISCTAYGSSSLEGRKILGLLKEQIELTVKVLRSVYLPGWRFLPTKTNKRVMEIQDEIRNLLRGIIQKQEKTMMAGEAPKDNLLGLLLESNHKEIGDQGNNKNVGMDIDAIIDECKLFYFAGQETTAVLLNWTIVLLSRFPNWQTKAREEVMEIFGSKKPDYDGLNRLKIVTMILNEVLRLYPPAAVLTRFLRKETKVGNFILPAGTHIAIPAMLVHHDVDLWGDDAEEFKPERFAEGILKATKGQISYLPFSWGPKICIGQNFGLIEIKMALSLILQNFAFELSPSYAHAPFEVLTVQPQFGTPIILHKL